MRTKADLCPDSRRFRRVQSVSGERLRILLLVERPWCPGCEVRVLRAQARSVADCSLTFIVVVNFSRGNRAPNNSVSGEVHGNFVACLLPRPGFEPPTVIPVPWLRSQVWRGLRSAPSKVSPVVKEKSYFAPNGTTLQGSETCRGADCRNAGIPRIGGRCPEGQGC